MTVTLSDQIRHVADKNGLKLIGIAPAYAFSDYRWGHTVMRDPGLTMPDAKSLIIACVCELNYLKESQVQGLSGRFARSYASGHEYNLVDELIPIMELLVNSGFIAEISPATIETSTIPLKLAAVRTGLGWQGKNSVIITKEYGSWVSFGGVITNAFLDYNESSKFDGCGKCTKCIDACPVGAITDPYIVDMALCLDLVLEKPGHIPDEIKLKIGNRIASCDTCLEVCPFNVRILKRMPLNGSRSYEFDLIELLNLNEKDFHEKFDILNWSLDWLTFKRNVIIALGNTGNSKVLKHMSKYQKHSDPVISETAIWSINQITNKKGGHNESHI
jgi:epoxyqueuosine reductase